MRSRSGKALRWLSGWLIAALLLAQQGALWHALEHLGSARVVATGAAVEPGSGSTGHEIGCAKCLAFAVLEHASSASLAPSIGHQAGPAPAPQLAPRKLPREAPPASSRDPPHAFS